MLLQYGYGIGVKKPQSGILQDPHGRFVNLSCSFLAHLSSPLFNVMVNLFTSEAQIKDASVVNRTPSLSLGQEKGSPRSGGAVFRGGKVSFEA